MTFWDILSMLGSLALIVLILVLTYYASRWYARRMRVNGAGSGQYIKVIDKTALGTGTALILVEIEKRYYLIGVAEKSVTLVGELPDLELPPDIPAESSMPFKQVFGSVLKQTLGKKKDDGEGQ